MKRVQLFGIAWLLVLFAVIKVEAYNWECNFAVPPYLGCGSFESTWYCEYTFIYEGVNECAQWCVYNDLDFHDAWCEDEPGSGEEPDYIGCICKLPS